MKNKVVCSKAQGPESEKASLDFAWENTHENEQIYLAYSESWLLYTMKTNE
jgi:hypothetical protein